MCTHLQNHSSIYGDTPRGYEYFCLMHGDQYTRNCGRRGSYRFIRPIELRVLGGMSVRVWVWVGGGVWGLGGCVCVWGGGGCFHVTLPTVMNQSQ